MCREDHSKFFCLSFTPIGSDRNWKVDGIKKSHFAKGKKKYFAVIFVFIIILTIIFFSKRRDATKIQGIKKTKRHLTTNEFDKYEMNLETHRSDIKIVPEKRKINRHPNHRYSEDETEGEPVNKLNDRFPEPSKIHEPPGNIQDVILKGKLSDWPGERQNRLLNEMQKGSGTSMRLKGVYKQARLPETQLHESNRYSKEINNLMQNSSENGGKKFLKNSLRSRGVPFQLPFNGRENLKRQKPDFRFNFKKHPITIYLDFYPMEEATRAKKIKDSQSKFPDVVAKESANIHKFLLPEKKQNGMVMKLNLHPKGRNLKKPHPRNNKKVERKSFGWFSKPEKKAEKKKKCYFVKLNTNGKHLTAKWKNEKGEWIHANHVILKYLKKEKDSNKK